MFAEEVLIPLLAIAGFYASIIVVAYLFFSSRNRIRMALIEQGRDASIFRTHTDKTVSLRNGLVAILSGVGLLLGFQLKNLGMPGPIAYTAMILIFGGFGLVAYYLYIRNRVGMGETV